MTQLLKDIRKALESRVDTKYKIGAARYSKEPVKMLGVRAADVRALAKDYYPQVKGLPKGEFFETCESLIKQGHFEEIAIAFDWTWRRRKQLDITDFDRLETWIERFVSNWGSCDDLCCHAIGYMLEQYPELIDRPLRWAKSPNRWFRRAAAVSLIYPARREVLVDEAFQVADILISDEDDLVRKGYGWLLKEISRKNPRRVFDYVVLNVSRMPRVAFRYAIEKLPKEMRKKAMEA